MRLSTIKKLQPRPSLNTADIARAVNQLIDYELDRPYGHFYFNGTKVITIGSGGTWVQIATAAAPDFTEGEVKNMSISDNEMIVDEAGKYQMTFGISMSTTAPGDQIAATFTINSTATETSHGHVTEFVSGDAAFCGGVTIVQLSAGDAVGIAVQNHTAARNITVIHFNASIVKVGE